MYGTLREWSAAQRHKLKFFREKYLKMYYNIRTDKKRKKLEKNNGECMGRCASGQQLSGGEWPRMVVAAGSLDKGTPRCP